MLLISSTILAALVYGCKPDVTDAPEEYLGCNGYLELCSRPLDQVTLPGTHNSMSNADGGWFLPNQQHGITQQLEDGIRSLMLDTHEWEGESYLCHGECELGSQLLVEGLGEIADFLDSHPREVVLIIFQDGISTDATVAAMESAGLSESVWAWDGESVPLPTLEELILAETQLVIFAEFGGPPPDWYHSAWSMIVDTPYDFSDSTQFSCAQNRGAPENPLYLVNHWLSTPMATESGAQVVNDAAVLGERADACSAEWDRPVNILAVDFYNYGDLFSVVAALNGL